jgi:hypothetical protein
MKKYLLIITFITLVYSCNNSDKTTTEETQNKNEVGVQNVNGNIPDTTNAIDLSTNKKDTTMNSKDSLK